ncbi:farnesol dehydrogenase-like [Chironomus tepperi]|uniref:farnesol dehydrogenase-like n=1 Tax=Chironomus tepperi TaxID=113505 RepID=UPI00391F8653
MDKWKDKVAVITGANSGCGLKILQKLLEYNLSVVCLDLKDDEVKKIRNKNIHSIICDITDNKSLNLAFKWIEENLNGIDILINNAGMTNNFGILDERINIEELEKCMDVNFLAGISCARLAYKSMMKDDKHGCIININSVSGHRVIELGSVRLGLYIPSKFAVTAATEIMRLELNGMNNKNIRVTSISPGLIDTSLFKTSKLPQHVVDHIEEKMEKLSTEDIADVIVYVLSVPYRINISEIILRATGSSF